MAKQYKVVITKIAGPVARLTAAKALRIFKSISLSEALDLIESVPCTVYEGPKAKADWLAKLRQAGLDINLEEIVVEPEPKSVIMQNEDQDKKMKVYTGKEVGSIPDKGRRLLILFGIIFLLGFLALRYITGSPGVGELRFNNTSLRIGMSKDKVLRRLNNRVDYNHNYEIGFWAKPFGVATKVECSFNKGTHDLDIILCHFAHNVYSAVEFRDKLEGVINGLMKMYGKPTKQRGSFGVLKEVKYRGIGPRGQSRWTEVEMNVPTYVGWKLKNGHEVEYYSCEIRGYVLRITDGSISSRRLNY
ncbi:hypothetical protein KAU86_03530 [bacterium]|nr:hypothetical protein [bacterium]